MNFDFNDSHMTYFCSKAPSSLLAVSSKLSKVPESNRHLSDPDKEQFIVTET